MAGLFQRRTAREKFEYHRAGEKKLLSNLKGKKMTDEMKAARSAGYMARVREDGDLYVWINATPPERDARKRLRKAKDWQKLKELENGIKARTKAEREKTRAKRA